MMVVPVMAIGKKMVSRSELVMVEVSMLVEATMEGVRGVNKEILGKARAERVLRRRNRLGRLDGTPRLPGGSRLACQMSLWYRGAFVYGYDVSYHGKERKLGPRIAKAGCYAFREIREFDAGGIVHVYRRLGRHFITAGI